MDVGCYCVSGSRLLAGEPERVFGVASTESGVDVAFAGTMSFPGDVVAQFDCGLRLPGRDELEAIGTEGSIFLDDPWHSRKPVLELRRDGGVEEIALEPVDSYRLELENLADAIEGRSELLLGREDALGQARTIDALYRSAETGEADSSQVVKPIRRWLPSQNGLFSEAPQRQRASLVSSRISSPSASTIFRRPRTKSGPFGRGSTVISAAAVSCSPPSTLRK